MHLIKCHFHEFRVANSNAKAEKVEKVGNFRGIQFRFTTWCSWCPSHILIIRVFSDAGGGKSSTTELKSAPKQFTEHDECILLRITISTLDFCCFRPRKSDLRRRNLIWNVFNLRPSARGRTVDVGSERRGKITREWNNQHNRSF